MVLMIPFEQSICSIVVPNFIPGPIHVLISAFHFNAKSLPIEKVFYDFFCWSLENVHPPSEAVWPAQAGAAFRTKTRNQFCWHRKPLSVIVYFWVKQELTGPTLGKGQLIAVKSIQFIVHLCTSTWRVALAFIRIRGYWSKHVIGFFFMGISSPLKPFSPKTWLLPRRTCMFGLELMRGLVWVASGRARLDLPRTCNQLAPTHQSCTHAMLGKVLQKKHCNPCNPSTLSRYGQCEHSTFPLVAWSHHNQNPLTVTTLWSPILMIRWAITTIAIIPRALLIDRASQVPFSWDFAISLCCEDPTSKCWRWEGMGDLTHVWQHWNSQHPTHESWIPLALMVLWKKFPAKGVLKNKEVLI